MIRKSLGKKLTNFKKKTRQTGQFLALLFITLTAVIWFTKPAPPRVIEMAAGRATDYSYQLALRYVDYFAKNGVELRLIPTQGALDNFERLTSKQDKTQVAILQAGLSDDPLKTQGLLSLGSIAYEPVWLFYWPGDIKDPKAAMIDILKSPLSIGNIGSGTHVKALQLLKINGLSPNPDTMLTLPEDEAIEALKARKIRAMLLVENHASPHIQELLALHADGLILADFEHAQAYEKQLGYIEVLHVPSSGFDLVKNYPDHDMQLLTTTSTLIVDKDLHPAIQMLFMEASSAIVSHETFFAEAGEFPSVKDPSIPLSEVARRFFEKGAPLLSYYVPFWVAEFIARMGLILVPFFAFAFPLAKYLPEFLEKQARKRIERLYGMLRQIENDVWNDRSLIRLEQQIEALEELEAEVISLKISRQLVAELYALRSDIHFVREILGRLKAAESGRDDPIATTAGG